MPKQVLELPHLADSVQASVPHIASEPRLQSLSAVHLGVTTGAAVTVPL